MRPGLLALLALPYAAFGLLLAIAIVGAISPWIAVVAGARATHDALDASTGSALLACASALALAATDVVRRRRGIAFDHPRPAARMFDV